MEWCLAIRHIEACTASLQGRNEAFRDEFTTLLTYLNYDDIVVAYAAKEKLGKLLVNGEAARLHDVVGNIILTSSINWQSERSGFRFQLLRQLIKVKTDSQKRRSRDELDHLHTFPYLDAVIKHLMQITAIVRNIFIPSGDRSASSLHSVQYETLLFVSDFTKCLRYVKITKTCQERLSRLVTMLMKDVIVKMDYCSQPTFVSCAVFGLLGDFQQLVKFWYDQTHADKKGTVGSIYQKWLGQCLAWFLESSCASTAFQLLSESKLPSAASCEAFITGSSVYSFLQQWLLLTSRMGIAFIEAFLAQRKCLGWNTLLVSPNLDSCAQHQLPSRRQLFVVLAEQDDVMIEVLNNVSRIADGINGFPNFHAHPYSHILIHSVAEFDPNLLFADLVDTFGQDHLVLLDLLVSNETLMLEYLLQYLRRLSTHWNLSKRKLQTIDRLEVVMSILIRLRLEIDRLVAANLFPYGVKPLIRRLMTVEQLYENERLDT